MDAIFILFIVLAVAIPIVGGLVWVIFFVWLAKAALSAAERELNQTLPALEQMLRQASQQGAGRFDAAQRAQLMNMFRQAQSQMSQLDDLRRQQYDVRMGELMGMAANAGIDWSPS